MSLFGLVAVSLISCLTWSKTEAKAMAKEPSLKFAYDSFTSTSTPSSPPIATDGHQPGGLPMISDSAFSLVILIYVSVAFCFVFFMFCWKTENARANGKGRRQCVLMSSQMEGINGAQTVVIPPTPPILSHNSLQPENEKMMEMQRL